ncbi:MAG: hypothetical protein QXV12_00835 [Candidatus Rehaiarchaeum fermentans]|nr:hypothetical protein [Candidatus Rehaiarchaeum fermentans]
MECFKILQGFKLFSFLFEGEINVEYLPAGRGLSAILKGFGLI